MRRYGLILISLATAAGLAGCAPAGRNDVGVPPVPADFLERAQTVVTAWHATGIEKAWKTGFVPLGELPGMQGDDPYRAGATVDMMGNAKMAVMQGWYRLVGMLPAGEGGKGVVTFADGATLPAPVLGARDAFAAMDKGDAGADCKGEWCTLTVRGATATTTKISTSRGLATVPAWAFTVDELRLPVLKLAVAPSAITTLPEPQLDPGLPNGINSVEAVMPAGPTVDVPAETAKPTATAWPVAGADPTALTRLRLDFVGGSCDKSWTGHAYETADAVVVGVTVVVNPGMCDMMGVFRTTDVELDAPVGARVLLDAASGRPLVLGKCSFNGFKPGC
jgi:hypothetical protein